MAADYRSDADERGSRGSGFPRFAGSTRVRGSLVREVEGFTSFAVSVGSTFPRVEPSALEPLNLLNLEPLEPLNLANLANPLEPREPLEPS
jgi:hypothetical protein